MRLNFISFFVNLFSIPYIRNTYHSLAFNHCYRGGVIHQISKLSGTVIPARPEDLKGALEAAVGIDAPAAVPVHLQGLEEVVKVESGQVRLIFVQLQCLLSSAISPAVERYLSRA